MYVRVWGCGSLNRTTQQSHTQNPQVSVNCFVHFIICTKKKKHCAKETVTENKDGRLNFFCWDSKCLTTVLFCYFSFKTKMSVCLWRTCEIQHCKRVLAGVGWKYCLDAHCTLKIRDVVSMEDLRRNFATKTNAFFSKWVGGGGRGGEMTLNLTRRTSQATVSMQLNFFPTYCVIWVSSPLLSIYTLLVESSAICYSFK